MAAPEGDELEREAGERRFRELVDAFPGGIIVTRRGDITFANEAAGSLFDVPADELVGRPVLDFIAPEDHDRARAEAHRIEVEGQAAVGRGGYAIIGARGQRLDVDAMHFSTRFAGDVATQTVLWDVTAQRRSARLRRAHERVVEMMARGARLDEMLRVITDTVADVLPGRTAAILLREDDVLRYAAGHERLDRRFVEATDGADVRAPATPCAVAIAENRLVVVDDVAGELEERVGAVATAAGIRSCWSTPIAGEGRRPIATFAVFNREPGAPTPDEVGTIERLHHLAVLAIGHDEILRSPVPASLDPLTGALSRTFALEILERDLAEVRAGERACVAVLVLDLDDFSGLNEALGHDVGDEVLRATADLLSGANEDDVVARFGGDAFLVLVRGCGTEDELDGRGQELQALLSAPFRAAGRDLYVSANVGMAISLDGLESASELVAGAESALHQARGAGPGVHRRLDQRLRLQARRRVELLPSLRRAIEEGELRLHYQPQVELATGAVVGVEALVRWEHPEQGLLHPGDFVPAAERTNLILDLGGWVLDEAARQAARWRDLRPERELTVSLNVSARQLSDGALAERVERALSGSSLDPARLRLELTETAVMSDAASAEVMLRRLRAIGIRLSIDDFGTGYSSLVYLKRLPVDELKIDRSFVAGLGQRPDDSAIVAGTIRLAQSLGIDTVAEGVEQADQAAELLRLGCPVAQGYLWMRPAPPEAVDAILNEGAEAVAIRDVSERAVASNTVEVNADEALRVAVHELRTPLTILRGFAGMMDQPAIMAKARPAVERAAIRMERILRSLSDVAALDRGGIHLELAWHKIGDVVSDVVDDVRRAGLRSPVELHLEPGAADVATRFDRVRIEQVLTNLFTNAARHGPAGGLVRLVVEVGSHEWSCSVLDEGEGVPLELATSIFRKYARGVGSTQGTGLGLYLARGIARAHGGDLTYRRPPGGGSEFRMTLPLSEPISVRRPPAPG